MRTPSFLSGFLQRLLEEVVRGTTEPVLPLMKGNRRVRGSADHVTVASQPQRPGALAVGGTV
jgi:hypothetical protein